jgi:hypothetical protein
LGFISLIRSSNEGIDFGGTVLVESFYIVIVFVYFPVFGCGWDQKSNVVKSIFDLESLWVGLLVTPEEDQNYEG